ncbi:hypothetical protein [Sphingopyxis sp. JAI128]|uniref:hypothetical protein n=1 Tax=Sphingopyxis sp. JAI128 TaxID=2723066 RepID=UPI001615E3B6|nr:hypothetical protein [Sphingopyxis sp. JAI128]MBB6426631.1 hypothetical protein [Sphingopyxis sp. JAI128]
MKVKTIRAAATATLAVGLALLPGAGHAADPLSIRLGDVPVKGVIPDGYCLPTGADEAAADMLAKGDRDNRTHAMLIRCDQRNKPGGTKYDYYLVKSPHAQPPAMKRAEFIALMTEELKLPAYQSGDATRPEIGKAGDNLSTALGTRVDLSGEIRPRGADAVCIYMGGELEVRSAVASYPIAVGGCGTVVAGQILFVYAYDDPAKPNSGAALLQRTRWIAERLNATDGRAN